MRKVSDALQLESKVVVLLLDCSRFLSQWCLLCVDMTAYWLWENWHIPESIWASDLVYHCERFKLVLLLCPLDLNTSSDSCNLKTIDVQVCCILKYPTTGAFLLNSSAVLSISIALYIAFDIPDTTELLLQIFAINSPTDNWLVLLEITQT